MMIEVKGLNKTYGDLAAVEDFNLSMDKSEILAVAGPDGAGKTSVFRAICGLIKYDTGRINVSGYDIAAQFEKVKPLLGYMPQSFSLYTDLSVEENLYFNAGLFGINRKQFDEKKKLLYEFSGLGLFANRRAGALSGGMKQKLALSCALIHEPEILILDEPTTGVDPLSRRQFWDILKNLRQSGSAILVSTPYMDEVAMADRVIFMFGGKKLAEGKPSSIPERFIGNVFRVTYEPTAEQLKLLNIKNDITVRRFGSSIHIYTPVDYSIKKFATDFPEVDIPLEKMEPIKPSLEDTFIQLMGKV